MGRCLCEKVKHPKFNFPEEKQGICCSICRTRGMEDIVSRRCSCKKSTYPVFNLPGEKRGICCASCRTLSMIDVVNKRCLCKRTTGPKYNVPGEKNGICCSSCQKEGMEDIVSLRCVCKKSLYPLFNVPGEKKGKYCSKCRTSEMIDVFNKRCLCKKTVNPRFNLPEQTRGICCASCRTSEMTDVVHNRCFCQKSKHPVFNLPGEKNGICCGKCKTEVMVDVVHKRCINCKGWPDFRRANKKYEGYCTRCFQWLFPNHPLTSTIRVKTKEIQSRDFLNSEFEGYIHDKPIWTDNCDCTIRRRIDHRKLINGTLLAIETDEFQHRRYDEKEEENRYNDLYMAWSGKLIFIRFNPDKYIDSKKKRRNPQMKTRLRRLKEEIEKQTRRIERYENREPLEIIKLYYDGFTT